MKRFIGMAIALMMISMLLVACGKVETNGEGGASAAGKIAVVGSTSVFSLVEELAAEYKKTADVTIDIQGVGSSAGVKAANDGSADIGMSSRELKQEEKSWGLVEVEIALDGIAVVLHPENKVEDLTMEQISKIFKGEINNWKEVGGVDKAIAVISREDGSGTRGAFEELLNLQAKKDDKTISLTKADALIANSNGGVKAGVAGKDAAIGYLSLGSVDSSVKSVKVGGVEATVENVKTKTFPIARPFLILTKGEASEKEKAFIDFILSGAGQKIVSKNYISIN